MGRSGPEKQGSASGRTRRRAVLHPEPASPLVVQGAEAEPVLTGALIERVLRASRCLVIARLAAPAAHEIVNPVSAVVNLAALMQSVLKDDAPAAAQLAELRDYATQVAGEAKRAGRIASEMLAFTRAASRGPSQADLNEIVKRAFSLAANLLKTEDVESHLALAEDLPWIRCDSTEVQYALLHLLINAVEAVEGCKRRQVTVSTRMSDDGRALLLKVQDTGEGIPAENRQRIFDPFFTTRKRPENLGLGLTVARSVMQVHRGSIAVESVPGEATSVTLVLPVENERERR